MERQKVVGYVIVELYMGVCMCGCMYTIDNPFENDAFI